MSSQSTRQILAEQIKPYIHFLDVDMNLSAVQQYCEVNDIDISDNEQLSLAKQLTTTKVKEAKKELENHETV